VTEKKLWRAVPGTAYSISNPPDFSRFVKRNLKETCEESLKPHEAVSLNVISADEILKVM
jgi:hypothetical protein